MRLPLSSSGKRNLEVGSREREKLLADALGVLKRNDLGHCTKPAPHLYPHQWLWDSCFVAIGLRHVNTKRAREEILSLFAGQWSNGMLPHEIFARNSSYHAGRKTWRSDRMEGAPPDVHTSGITQPPVVAEAVVRIGEKLNKKERLAFYKQIYPSLLQFHQWLYRERDPYETGLVTLLHSHESGLDNVPYWTVLTAKVAPMRVRALRTLKQDDVLDYLRKDKKVAHDPTERMSSAEIHTLYHIIAQLRRMEYDFKKLLERPAYRTVTFRNNIPLVQDVIFNAILIRANHHLRTIAREIGASIPDELLRAMEKTPHAFETLFSDGAYWSRNFRTGELIKEPTIGTFLSIYAGTISPERVKLLARQLQEPNFWAAYGIATTPMDSAYFHPRRYWQGPVWVNMNWMIADGLERYGHRQLAKKIRTQTIRLVAEHGMFEYFSPVDGAPAGTHDFSWTAALVIDMLARKD